MIMMQFLLEILHKISSVYFEKKKINNQKRKALLGQLLVQHGARWGRAEDCALVQVGWGGGGG